MIYAWQYVSPGMLRDNVPLRHPDPWSSKQGSRDGLHATDEEANLKLVIHPELHSMFGNRVRTRMEAWPKVCLKT